MEDLLKFFSDNKDALLAIGVILTFLASIMSLYFSVRNNKAVHYVNAITKSRIEWIQKVRELISDFVAIASVNEGHVFIHGDKEINEFNNKLYRYTTEIKLLLNYSGKLDKRIIKSIETIANLSREFYVYLYLCEEIGDSDLSIQEKDEIVSNSELGKRFLCHFIKSCGYTIEKSEQYDLLESIRIKNILQEMRNNKVISEDADWVVGIGLQIIGIREEIERKIEELSKEVHIYLKSEWNRVKYESQGKTYEKETQEFDIVELEEKYENSEYKNNVWKRFCINTNAKARRVFGSSGFTLFALFVGIVILAGLIIA